MAARWGAGEETLTACNMDFFHMDTLDETAGHSSDNTLEALQSCLDPSILSIFEDTPTIETKGLNDESEATLLTALTEILDNVDEENLSPFDTLPDTELLSGQKGRELSPLRRLLCLSRSPPEKDVSCGRTLSTGKSLPRIQGKSLQRSDGEEEEDGSFTLSPPKLDSCPDTELLDWEGLALPLPATVEQACDEGLSVSLGDLVRHMHPYCMAICVENEEGEQMLPEGGIVLEVVDQGENGEPILAIPDMALPFLQPQEQHPESEQNSLGNDDSSELIVVDDDLKINQASPKTVAPVATTLHSDDKDGMIVKNQKEEMRKERASWKKKKKKCKEQPQPEPVEGRVLRSARRAAQKTITNTEVEPIKTRKERKVSKTPVASTPVPVKPKERVQQQTEVPAETTTTALSSTINVTKSPKQDENPSSAQESSETVASPQLPDETLKQESLVESSAPPSAAAAAVAAATTASPASLEIPVAAVSSETPQTAPPVSEVPSVEAPAVPEPKPKSLSLEQYRRLRQQKKPAPVEKVDTSGTKWPSLPELPKELPPIPCLPNPSPKDPRRAHPQAAKNDGEEVRPAWHPRGPAAPPTPEALLVPPAYMVAASSRASATAAVPSKLPQKSSTPAPDSKQSGTESCGPSVKPTATQLSSPAEINGTNVSGGKSALVKTLQSQSVSSKSTETIEACHKTTTGVKSASVSEKAAVPPRMSEAAKAASPQSPVASDSKSVAPKPSDSQRMKAKPVVLETKKKPTTALKPVRARDPTQELIEAFTSEIGIEAADLTSLLEQFEETQAKEEQCVPEVSGRAAAVGNSSVEPVPEKSAVERVRANEFLSTAALTPPATPPHQMWKPLAPMSLLGKNKIAEVAKSAPSKVIQIDARPLPSAKARSKPTPAAAPVDASIACMDHDYCLSNKSSLSGEPGKRWNVKQQSFITIKPIKPQPAAAATQTLSAAPASPLQAATNPQRSTKTNDVPLTQTQETSSSKSIEENSILETPDASPDRQETESTFRDRSPRRRPFERSYRHHASSRSPSPTQSPKERTGGRSGKRKSHRSPSPMSSCSESDSNSSRSRSRSFSPRKKRYRRRSESSSRSSSCSSTRSGYSVSRSPPRRRRYSYSSSRSGSWSRSRSRSQSPQRRAQCNWSRNVYSPTYRSYCSQGTKANGEEVKRRKEKAIEERRVVYVGRIRGTMTQKELKERFSYFGEIEECTLHFRDQGDNYGFVTYYDTKDAFTAIENGGKLRKPDELPFDLCFGGRRQFCQSSYADLDSNREYDPLPGRGKYHALDFDTLLKQAQQNMKR
ncbi:unnamed protein product [Ophioblennius macclurei]